MNEIDFERDTFEDILSKDKRFNARAYALLMDCVDYLAGQNGKTDKKRKHISAAEILDEFRARALDQYGPLTYTVLTEWGVQCCEDVGEMMFNLAEFKRVRRDEEDTPECFLGGYDFQEAFLGPYQT